MLHPCGKSTWVSYNHSTFKIKKNKSLNFKVSPQVKTIFFLPKYWGTPIISIFFLTFWFTLKNSGFCCFLLNHNTIRNLISHGWVLWVSLLIGQLQNYIHRWIQQLAWVTQVAGSSNHCTNSGSDLFDPPVCIHFILYLYRGDTPLSN